MLPALNPAGPTRVLLAPVAELTLARARDLGVDLSAALAGVPYDGAVDIPPCLGGHADVEYADAFPLAAVDAGGRLDLHRFVDSFLRRRYRIKSLRCTDCLHDSGCRGIGLQRARVDGLATLSPVGR